MTGQRPAVAVVLAAGKGTRMRSATPKVLHEAAGRPLLGWVLDSAAAAGCERVLVVVGHGSEAVEARFAADEIDWVVQEPQLGTGHALAQVEAALDGAPALLLVLSGDVPLVRPETIAALLAAAAGGFAAMAVAELGEPGSLGRVLARSDGTLERIVEARDASTEELALGCINAGLYALPAPEIFSYLRRLDTANAQGELYLTDAVSAAAADGRRVTLVPLEDPREAWGVNTREELARVHRVLVERKLAALMESGVTIVDPARVEVEAGVVVGADTVLHADVALRGMTRIGERCTLHQGAWLEDVELGDGVTVEPYSVLQGAQVASGARVGPFARLRPGAELGAGARVGNFVEVKNSRLGRGTKANHLAYLGDAEVGDGANIGAGTITCNYDGRQKHRTEIGHGAFVGSDTMLVAPVRVGAGATTAAGSVITRDVPDGALGIARERQKNIEGWSARRQRDPRKKKD